MTGPQGGSWIPLGGALKGMWEKAVPGLQITADARRGDRQRARRGRRQGAHRLRQLEHHGRRPEGRPPYPEEGDQGLPGRQPVSAVLPGRGAGGRESQLVRRPQGQVAGHAAQGQHRRAADRARPQDERPDLPVARQGQLRQLHRVGRDDEGRPREGVHARHHGARVGGDGSRSARDIKLVDRSTTAAWTS